MSVATLLLTGPRLPYHVLDYAINWAKDHEGSIRTLFLIPGQVPEESYPFPNDLDEAEELTTHSDIEKGIAGLVQDEIRFIEKRCKASHVPVTTELMFTPALKKVTAKLNETDIIFIDRNLEENEDELSDLTFGIDDIAEKISKHLVAVGEMDRYSDVVY